MGYIDPEELMVDESETGGEQETKHGSGHRAKYRAEHSGARMPNNPDPIILGKIPSMKVVQLKKNLRLRDFLVLG